MRLYHVIAKEHHLACLFQVFNHTRQEIQYANSHRICLIVPIRLTRNPKWLHTTESSCFCFNWREIQNEASHRIIIFLFKLTRNSIRGNPYRIIMFLFKLTRNSIRGKPHDNFGSVGIQPEVHYLTCAT